MAKSLNESDIKPGFVKNVRYKLGVYVSLHCRFSLLTYKLKPGRVPG